MHGTDATFLRENFTTGGWRMKVEVTEEFVRQHEFLLVFYNVVWNQNWVSTDKVWEWTKEAEKSSGYDKNGEKVS